MKELEVLGWCGACKHSNASSDAYPCLECRVLYDSATSSKFEHIPKGLEHAYDGQMVEAHEILAEDSIAATSALSVQEGGSHYKDCAIQPVEYIHHNGLGFLEGNVVKYITRHKAKNGKADILKARHYIDLLLELEYGGAKCPLK